ncbi:hypothetical protein Syun_016019 [Stephania yunnanensis]|uniref:Uncharacterized protein n=1 Tax=Stephania yunnanensis TaxID=152371 RepID=A0AAP0P0Z5_9MAGN
MSSRSMICFRLVKSLPCFQLSTWPSYLKLCLSFFGSTSCISLGVVAEEEARAMSSLLSFAAIETKEQLRLIGDQNKEVNLSQNYKEI